MTDPFGGSWLVTEYVHDPGGRLVGLVRQRRTLETVAGGRVRVTQICESEGLDGHPMAAFAGTWVFDMTIDGALRTYEGPDVVGHGVQWSAGAMTGEGIWPRFGYTFESYAVVVSPRRQITGGFFGLAGRSVADIVGVAEPDDGGWPLLDLAARPPEVPATGPGVARKVGPLAIAENWPSPTERVRTLAMTDSGSGASVVLTDRRQRPQRRVEVSVEF